MARIIPRSTKFRTSGRCPASRASGIPSCSSPGSSRWSSPSSARPLFRSATRASDVFRPVTKGRNRKQEDIQSIIEIFPKPSVSNHRREIPVCGSDYANIHLDGFRASSRSNSPSSRTLSSLAWTSGAALRFRPERSSSRLRLRNAPLDSTWPPCTRLSRGQRAHSRSGW